MYNIIVVSNKTFFKNENDYLKRLKEINAENIPIIIREKTISKSEYIQLFKKIISTVQKPELIIPHTYMEAAKLSESQRIHVPLKILETNPETYKPYKISTSTHSASDAVLAEKMGADFILAGHVFETDCKAGLPGRGCEFIEKVSGAVKIPVYGIGGIKPENVKKVICSGAKGVCLMSSAMNNDNSTLQSVASNIANVRGDQESNVGNRE